MAFKILVIEDVPEQSRPFIQMLRYRGYEVWTADNGIDGVAKTIRHRPDLVVVDLWLKERGDEIDGHEVIQRVLQNSIYG